jgi:hypothetical protein
MSSFAFAPFKIMHIYNRPTTKLHGMIRYLMFYGYFAKQVRIAYYNDFTLICFSSNSSRKFILYHVYIPAPLLYLVVIP